MDMADLTTEGRSRLDTCLVERSLAEASRSAGGGGAGLVVGSAQIHSCRRPSAAVARRSGCGTSSLRMRSLAGAEGAAPGGKAKSASRMAASVAISVERSKGWWPHNIVKSSRPTAHRSTSRPYLPRTRARVGGEGEGEGGVAGARG